MIEVILLKAVGDHPKGSKLKIKDESVLDAWKRLGVIEDEGKAISKMNKGELQEFAKSLELPPEEWQKLNKGELVVYLSDK